MTRYALLTTAMTIVLGLCPADWSFSQSVLGVTRAGIYTSALTIHPNGSWGVATESTTSGAIAIAIANCKIMSSAEIGCGSSFRTMQEGWLLGLRCGDHNIIVAAKTRPEA